MTRKTSCIQWKDVRARLKRSEEAFQRASAPDETTIRRIFCERAARLSQPKVLRNPQSDCRVLIFAVGGERYAIELRYVDEVMPLTNCTHVPGGPRGLCGIVNHRGDARSVMSLAHILGTSSDQAPESGFLVVLRDDRRHLLVRVDRVELVREIDTQSLASPPGCGGDSITKHVQGIHADGTILLSAKSIIEEVTAPSAA